MVVVLSAAKSLEGSCAAAKTRILKENKINDVKEG